MRLTRYEVSHQVPSCQMLGYKESMAARKLKNIAGTETDFVLEIETQEFDQRQAELERLYMGKVVMFKGTQLFGPFETIDAAIREGMKLFGDVPFLIRRVGAPPLSKASLAFHLG